MSIIKHVIAQKLLGSVTNYDTSIAYGLLTELARVWNDLPHVCTAPGSILVVIWRLIFSDVPFTTLCSVCELELFCYLLTYLLGQGLGWLILQFPNLHTAQTPQKKYGEKPGMQVRRDIRPCQPWRCGLVVLPQLPWCERHRWSQKTVALAAGASHCTAQTLPTLKQAQTQAAHCPCNENWPISKFIHIQKSQIQMLNTSFYLRVKYSTLLIYDVVVTVVRQLFIFNIKI